MPFPYEIVFLSLFRDRIHNELNRNQELWLSCNREIIEEKLKKLNESANEVEEKTLKGNWYGEKRNFE